MATERRLHRLSIGTALTFLASAGAGGLLTLLWLSATLCPNAVADLGLLFGAVVGVLTGTPAGFLVWSASRSEPPERRIFGIIASLLGGTFFTAVCVIILFAGKSV